MRSWVVIIGDSHQRRVEAKTAKGATLAAIARLGPNAYSAGVYEVRVWPIDEVGAPTAAAKVSTVTLAWVPKLTEDGETQGEPEAAPEPDTQPDAGATGPEAGEV